MEINENDIDLFEKYLNGTLKPDELVVFEKKLSSGKIFSAKFSEFKVARKAVTISGRQQFKKQFSAIMAEEDLRQAKRKKSVSFKRVIWEVFDKFFIPYENILTARSDPNKDDVLFKAMSFYSKGEYENASVIFKKLIKKDPENLLYYFYYGISELSLNNFENSKKLFKKIISADKEILNDLARWYLGLNYLKSGNIKSARKQFKDLTGKGKLSECQRILQEIENL